MAGEMEGEWDPIAEGEWAEAVTGEVVPAGDEACDIQDDTDFS